MITITKILTLFSTVQCHEMKLHQQFKTKHFSKPFSVKHNIKHIGGTAVEQSSPTSLLSLLASCKDFKTLNKIHGLIVVHGMSHKISCQTKLLSCYASIGKTGIARKVFDRIPNPDHYSWKVLLRWYVLNEEYQEAISCYARMTNCVVVSDDVVFSFVLKACVKLLDFDTGKKLHCHVVRVGSVDVFLQNVLIDMYEKCGDMVYARRVFDKMSDRSVVSWTSIMSGYVHSGFVEEALIVFNDMQKESVEVNEYVFASLFMACSLLDAVHQGKWVHGLVIKRGLGREPFLITALLDMYVKSGEVADARSVFDGMDSVDVVSWTAMIVGYTQKGIPIEAMKLFCDSKWEAIVPNSVTIASVLSASAQLIDSNLGSSVHAVGMKLGVANYHVVLNALIDMYAKCSMIREAICIFEGVPRRDIVTWNAMITGCSQNDFGSETLMLFNRMRLSSCQPDAITLVCAFSACVSLGDIAVGSSFHVYAIKYGFFSNIYVSTALLNLYNKYGELALALKVFDEMDTKNTVSWSAMMVGLGRQGDPHGSIDLFNKMLKGNVMPNDVAFTCILSTCSHSGLVDEGKKYFDSMSRHYNVVPSMKHYACMVDMLARAGKLEEAIDFIERMPMKPDTSVWGALLHGCSLHSQLELGEVAIRRLIELLPRTPDYYVLISNFYASDGRWKDASNIRKFMKEKNLIKLPGYSS